MVIAEPGKLIKIVNPEGKWARPELGDMRNFMADKPEIGIVFGEHEKPEGEPDKIIKPPRPTLHQAKRRFSTRGLGINSFLKRR